MGIETAPDSSDIDRRCRLLTSEQAEVLRLTANGRTSKEIARSLGRSKSAIDQRLDRARDLLGAASRRDAARLFASWFETCDRITRDPEAIAYTSMPVPSATSEGEEHAASPFRVRDVGQSFGERQSGIAMIWMWVREGARPNGLSKSQRLGVIIGIALLSVMVPAGLSILMLVLYQLARALWNSSLI